MRLIKLNRRKRTVFRKLDENGKKKLTLVVMYDDLTKAQTAVLLHFVKTAYPLFGGSVSSEDIVSFWVEMLADVESSAASAAVRQYIQTSRFPPTIADIRSLIADQASSHAAGLDYVPYDGYIAELHKGERVLSADQVQAEEAQMVTFAPQFVAALSAMGGGAKAVTTEHYGGAASGLEPFVPTINVTYNITGGNANGIVDALSEHNDSLVELIVDVMDNRALDRQRRGYD